MDLGRRNEPCPSATKLITGEKISFNTSFPTTLRNVEIFQTWENKNCYDCITRLRDELRFKGYFI